MRSLLLLFLAFTLLSSCARSRLSRTPYESLIGTVRDPHDLTCGSLKAPREYCGATPQKLSLYRAPKSPPPNPKCERFYTAAIRASDIQCDYEAELTHLHKAGEFSDTPYLADRLKQIHLRYQRAGEKAGQDLEQSYSALSKPNEEQERTFRNITWSLGVFLSRMSLDKSVSGRSPASVHAEKNHKVIRNGESVPDIMQKLIVPMPPSGK